MKNLLIYVFGLFHLSQVLASDPPLPPDSTDECKYFMSLIVQSGKYRSTLIQHAAGYLKGVTQKVEVVKAAQKIGDHRPTQALYSNPATSHFPTLAEKYTAIIGLLKDYQTWMNLDQQLDVSSPSAESDREEIQEILSGFRIRMDALVEEIKDLLLDREISVSDDLFIEINAPNNKKSMPTQDRSDSLKLIVEMYDRLVEGMKSQGLAWQSDIVETEYDATSGAIEKITLHIRGRGAGLLFIGEAGYHDIEKRITTAGRSRGKPVTHSVRVNVYDADIELSPGDYPASDFVTEYTTAQGPGGQNVNKVATAVRMTHKPTGLSVKIQITKSQHLNQAIARNLLIARVREEHELDQKLDRQAQQRQQTGIHNDTIAIRKYDLLESPAVVRDLRVGQTYDFSEIMEAGVDLMILIHELQLLHLEKLLRLKLSQHSPK